MAGATVIIGMGGLGCPAAVALASAGMRRLTLVDGDRIETSNLHRQPLYGPADVGRPKVDVARERLEHAFPGLEIQTWVKRVGPADVDGLLSAHTLAIDGTDSVGAKFLLSDAVTRTGIPLVSGGVVQWGGQAMRIDPGGPASAVSTARRRARRMSPPAPGPACSARSPECSARCRPPSRSGRPRRPDAAPSTWWTAGASGSGP